MKGAAAAKGGKPIPIRPRERDGTGERAEGALIGIIVLPSVRYTRDSVSRLYTG